MGVKLQPTTPTQTTPTQTTSAPTTLALDFGSTKIDICRLAKSGKIMQHSQVKTQDLEPGHPDFLQRAFDLIAHHLDDSDDKIGLSWNAPVHEGRLTQSSLLGGKIDVNLTLLLSQKFHRCVQVESDVHAMVLGEYRFGIGQQDGAPLLLINLGSGAGIGYHGESLMRGFRGGAGLVCMDEYYMPEIREMVILDHLFSGRGITHLYHHLTGQTRTARAIAALASAGDAMALRLFQIFGSHFGRYLVTMARLFNPKTIVIAGSVAKAQDLFLPQARQILREKIEPACRPQQVTISQLTALACLGLV